VNSAIAESTAARYGLRCDCQLWTVGAAAGGQEDNDERNELQAAGREQGLPVVLTVD